MATINMTKSTAGYVDPRMGVYGGVCAVTDNLVSDTDQLRSNRNGLELLIFHVTAVANAETLTTYIDDIVAVAWQPEDATDDDVRVSLTTQANGILTFVAGGTRQGWLWILHGGGGTGRVEN
jgi:hypothetical protein